MLSTLISLLSLNLVFRFQVII